MGDISGRAALLDLGAILSAHRKLTSTTTRLKDLQAIGVVIEAERFDNLGMAAEMFLNGLRRLVAATQPDDFRRWAEKSSDIRKIGIPDHQHKTVEFGVLPDGLIISLVEAKAAAF